MNQRAAAHTSPWAHHDEGLAATPKSKFVCCVDEERMPGERTRGISSASITGGVDA
jgi:hypothetical protein